MAADSAITRLNDDGSIKEVDEVGWQKLFKVPSIYAGVSYWGLVGRVAPGGNFEIWMKDWISQTARYNDLRSLADHIANEMNRVKQHAILEKPTGVHVAGFSDWEDRVCVVS